MSLMRLTLMTHAALVYYDDEIDDDRGRRDDDDDAAEATVVGVIALDGASARPSSADRGKPVRR